MSANILPTAPVPAFDLQTGVAEITNSTVGNVITLSVPAQLTNKTLYFGILANDLVSYTIAGRLEFLLDQSSQQIIEVQQRFPVALATSYHRLPMQWTRVRTDALALASDFELSQSTNLTDDELQFIATYTNTVSHNFYYYIVRLGGYPIRATFNRVQLNIEKVVKVVDTTYTPGKLTAFLGIKSQ